MTDQRMTLVKSIVDRYILFLESELKNFAESLGRKGTIRGGAWFKDWSIFAYVSYTPHNDSEEDSIESINIIEFHDGREIMISSDVCWTSGEIIAEIAQLTFTKEVSDETLGEQLDEKLEEVSNKVILRMKELIRLDGPKKISKH